VATDSVMSGSVISEQPGGRPMDSRDDRIMPDDPPTSVFSESPTVATAPATPPLLIPLPPDASELRTRPGMGFLEAVAWMVGLQVAQVLAGLAAASALAGWYVWNGGVIDELSDGVELGRQHLPEILVGAQIGSVAFALWAILWRGRGLASNRVEAGWKLPRVSQMFAIIVAAVPLSLLCSAVQAWAFQWSPSSHSDMRGLFETLRGASPGALLFAIAIAPALAEEFVFRGVIGRGLVARRGWIAGVLVTTLLFSAAHLNLAQSLGVLPMGLALHWVYFTTRSIWGPVLLHFLNNGLAVLLLTVFPHWVDQTPAAAGPQGELLLVSAAVVLGVALFLWETRRICAEEEFEQVLTPDELPLAPKLAACERRDEPGELTWVTAGLVFNGLGFLAVLSRAW
jgi:membrane protease YdiL (CAAX protease family)